jgi:hypothetical protein
MRIKPSNALVAALVAFALAGCSRTTPEDNSVLKSATIEIQQTLRTRFRSVRAPRIVEITDPVVLRELRNAVRASPDEASGSRALWTAVGSITFVDVEGEKTRFLVGDTHWAKSGEDLQYPLPEGFKDRLIEVIEAIQSKE